MQMTRKRLIWALALAVGLAATAVSRPTLHLLVTTLQDRNDRPSPPRGFIDDASGLGETPVKEVWDIPADPLAAERELVALVLRARTEGLPISIAGARHSMGGHSIRRDGIVINMLPFHDMKLDASRNVLHVQAGALWSEVVPYLNASGRSVAVMQSNNSFSVGGSISVNCHGWQANRPPIASTVESFRLLKADGSIVRCSRAENAELFSLVLGGYGLFGVVLDVELRVVPNEQYRLERLVIPSEEYAEAFAQRVRQHTDVGMAYGRLSVEPETFLRVSILNMFYRTGSGVGQPSRVDFPEIAGLTRAMFRGQVASDYGKRLRWQAEKSVGGLLSKQPIHRNQLLGEPAAVFENRSAASTDILHEYFVPSMTLQVFVDQVRSIVPKHKGDLLNVTVRHVLQDDDTFLRYADRDMFAIVMLFHQPRTQEGDASMEPMTRELVDAALRLGGRYYLPYRLHATEDQLHAAYPQASRFFEMKRRHDPQELFQNSFYAKYALGRSPRK